MKGCKNLTTKDTMVITKDTRFYTNIQTDYFALSGLVPYLLFCRWALPIADIFYPFRAISTIIKVN